MLTATNTIGADTTAGATLYPTGKALYSPEPLAPDFGVHLCSDDMAPAYRKGDTLLVRHRRKGEPITDDADYLFAATIDPVPGGRVTLVRLIGRTATYWLCRRHNMRTKDGRLRSFKLPRREWTTAYVVVGKYRTSNPALAGRA